MKDSIQYLSRMWLFSVINITSEKLYAYLIVIEINLSICLLAKIKTILIEQNENRFNIFEFCIGTFH